MTDRGNKTAFPRPQYRESGMNIREVFALAIYVVPGSGSPEQAVALADRLLEALYPKEKPDEQ